MKRKLLAALCGILAVGSASAIPMTGLGTDGRLYLFDSESPNTIVGSVPITGLSSGETLIGIDKRPATGEIFGIGTQGRVYSINGSGAASTLSTATVALTGTSFGVDFNPTVDRIRVVSNVGENLRFNPLTGGVAGTDTTLTPAGERVGVAYDRSVPSATITTMFVIDSQSDTLGIQGGVDGTPSPNGGVITTIGPLGVNTSSTVGFDIASTGEARALLNVGGVNSVYNINLTTGAATFVGNVPAGVNLTDITFLNGFPTPVLVTQIPSMNTFGLLALGSLLVLGAAFAVKRYR